jgi:hypothetical protein
MIKINTKNFSFMIATTKPTLALLLNHLMGHYIKHSAKKNCSHKTKHFLITFTRQIVSKKTWAKQTFPIWICNNWYNIIKMFINKMNGRKIHSFQRQINQNEIRSKSNEKKNHNNIYVFFLFVLMKKKRKWWENKFIHFLFGKIDQKQK